MKPEQFNTIFFSFLNSFRVPILYTKTNLPMAFWLVEPDNKVTQHGITVIKYCSLIVNRKRLISISLIEERENIFVNEIQFIINQEIRNCSPLDLGQLYIKYAKEFGLPQVVPFCHLLISCFQSRSIDCELKYPSLDTVENTSII